MLITLNIGTVKGINHGSYKEQMTIEDTLNLVADELSLAGLRFSLRKTMSMGGDWNPETIVVAEVNCRINHPNDDIGSLWFALQELVRITDQDAIAVHGINHVDGGFVLFHPNYEGERYDFNVDYFVK